MFSDDEIREFDLICDDIVFENPVVVALTIVAYGEETLLVAWRDEIEDSVRIVGISSFGVDTCDFV